MTTNATLQKKQFKLGKITSSQHSAALLAYSLSTYFGLIPQMKLQLNLLCQSNISPNLSLYAHRYGYHNYNNYPCVPIGMEAMVNDNSYHRKSFTQHYTKRYILGTSTKQYCCWKVGIPVSGTMRNSIYNTNTSLSLLSLQLMPSLWLQQTCPMSSKPISWQKN
jgi:hypothetical protein